MRYFEFENALYRRNSDVLGAPVEDVLIAGAWVQASGESTLKAPMAGVEVSEEDASAFAGEEWPTISIPK